MIRHIVLWIHAGKNWLLETAGVFIEQVLPAKCAALFGGRQEPAGHGKQIAG
jgi:hypothetical protein